MHRSAHLLPRLLVIATAAGASIGLLAAPSFAAPSPVAGGVPATVSMDPLPTVQINGVVWAQVTVGNTVYAVGNFTSSRPAGSPSGTNETPTGGIIAYDITTGNRIASFSHSLNGPGYAIAASPDGSTIYVGGSFTTVDGTAHNRVAAFSTATGALIGSYAPSVNSDVTAMAASANAVYFGGSFTAVNGASRSRLAATTPAGALLPWAPTVGDNSVKAMALSPDASRVWVGGTFGTLNGAHAYGLGLVDGTTGASIAFPGSTMNFGGDGNSGVLTLTTGGTAVYGGAYNYYGSGNLEGTFSLNATTGAANWVNDCNGDTYSVFPIADVLYDASHAHDCSSMGAFPGTVNSSGAVSSFHRGLAFTTASSGYDNVKPDEYGWNWTGYQHATMLNWFPSITAGTFTGQHQGAWSVTGTTSYVAMGGEFPSVNGVAQQGLVRFALHANAPNAYGPSGIGTPTVTTQPIADGGAAAVVTLTGAYDPDDGYLTYKLIRDGNTAKPVDTVVARTTGFWTTQPQVTLVDASGVTGTHTYRVQATGSGPLTTTTSAVSATLGTAVTARTFTPTTGGTATDAANPGSTAVVGAPVANGDAIRIPVQASGGANLPAPTNACVVVTATNGATTTLQPVSTNLLTQSPTSSSSQQTFLVPRGGTYRYQYVCGGTFSPVTLGTASGS